jgi:hypothetical protein
MGVNDHASPLVPRFGTMNLPATALNTDLAWVRERTRVDELARRWDEQGRGKGATLRGADLEAAVRRLDRRPADANAPTVLHQDFHPGRPTTRVRRP